jgi:AI-2 transport protein TqsA
VDSWYSWDSWFPAPEDDLMTPSNPGEKVTAVCLVILTTIAIGAALKALEPVMVPFVLAVFLALIVAPLVNLQVERLHLPRPVAVVITLLLSLGLLLALGLIVGFSVAGLEEKATLYEQRVQGFEDWLATWVPWHRLGLNPKQALEARLSQASAEDLLKQTGGAILDVFSRGALVLIFLFFLLLGGQARRVRAVGTWWEAEEGVKRYIRTKVLTSALTAFLVGGVLWLLNVELAWTFALFAFVLNFIPSIGGIVATLLPLPVALLEPGATVLSVVLVLAIPGGIQFVVGNVLEPKILGTSLDLHPVVILLSLIFWGFLWGITGAFLAVPITGVIKIYLEKFPLTAPAAEVMAGRLDALRGITPPKEGPREGVTPPEGPRAAG